MISAVARAFTFGNVPVEPRKRTRQTGVAALECAEDSTENDQVHSAVSTNSQRARQSRRRAAAQGRKGRVTRRRGQRVTLAPAPLKPAPPFRLVSALSRDALSVVVECLGANDLCRFILTAKSSATAAREDGVWSVHLRTMCPSTTQIEYAKAVYSRTLVAGLELRAWVVEQAQPLMVDGASILPANDAGVISSAFDCVAALRSSKCAHCCSGLLDAPTAHACPFCASTLCEGCMCPCACRSCGAPSEPGAFRDASEDDTCVSCGSMTCMQCVVADAAATCCSSCGNSFASESNSAS